MRVVLVQQKHFFDRRLVLHEAGQGFHFLRCIGIETEMPVAATLVGQRGVHGGVVEVHHLFAGIAGIVLGHRIRQRQCCTRAVALRDVAKALVHRCLEGIECLLGRALAVHAHHLKLHASSVLGTVVTIGDELPALELVLPHVGKRARQAFDHGDLDRFAFLRHGGKRNRHQRRCHHLLDCEFHVLSPMGLNSDRNQNLYYVQLTARRASFLQGLPLAPIPQVTGAYPHTANQPCVSCGVKAPAACNP